MESPLGGLNLRFGASKSNQADRITARMRVGPHHFWRVAGGINSDQNGLDVIAGGLRQHVRQRVHRRRADIRAMREAEIDHRRLAGKIGLGHLRTVTVHQIDRPADGGSVVAQNAAWDRSGLRGRVIVTADQQQSANRRQRGDRQGGHDRAGQIAARRFDGFCHHPPTMTAPSSAKQRGASAQGAQCRSLCLRIPANRTHVTTE